MVVGRVIGGLCGSGSSMLSEYSSDRGVMLRTMQISYY